MGIVLGFWDLRHTHPRIRSPRLHLYASPRALFTLPGISRSHKLRYHGSSGASKNNCDANRMHMRTQLTRCQACQASSVYVLSHWPLATGHVVSSRVVKWVRSDDSPSPEVSDLARQLLGHKCRAAIPARPGDWHDARAGCEGSWRRIDLGADALLWD